MRKLGKVHNDSSFYMEIARTRPPETIANMAISLINQTTYLLRRQIIANSEACVKEGGFREKMIRHRQMKEKTSKSK